MKIRDYIPEIYNSNLEMQVLENSIEVEFENDLKKYIDNRFNDTFIVLATEDGIEKFEKMFGIIPDKNTEDLETRRLRIQNRLISQIPFTETFLKNKLNEIIGKNNWNYTINYNNYTLTVNITTPGRTWLNELNELFKKVIPCNIAWSINIYAASWQSVKDNFNTWQDVYDSDMTWQEVMDGEWL